MSDCTCTAPGRCPAFGRDMTARDLEICKGEYASNPLPEETREKFLRWWKDGSPVQTNPEAPGLPPACPHLWKRVRDEGGEVVTRKCGTCPGAPALDLFECRCPARRQGGGHNDHVTLADCMTCDWRPRNVEGARKYILLNKLSPGDVLVSTAAVHGLQRRHPGKFRIAVDTTADPLWEHNPDVEPLARAREEKWEEVQLHYPLVNESNQRGLHMMFGYCDFLSYALKVEVPLLTNRPLVYLSAEEKSWMNQVEQEFGYRGKFWLLSAGRKHDFTAKFWGTRNYKALVERLRGRVQFVQVGSAEHHHPPIEGAFNLVGKTDLRQLVRLMHHAEGAVGGTTLLMHLAAALQKPYVCILGGREPVPWNQYPYQQTLHTLGALPCCKEGGCWKSRTVKLNDGSEQDGSLCECPVPGEEPVPRCLELIGADEVAAKVRLCHT